MIPVNEPLISKNANKYVSDCIKSGWIAEGKYIQRFEDEFSKLIGVKYAVTTTSGTTALHLALASLNIGKGDEVIIPDLTIISCAFAVIYTGATPVLVDVEKGSGNINPEKIEEKITKKTKAIMIVHLYGQPAKIDPILKIAKKHKIKVIEDSAEAHGAKYNNKIVGSFGDVGCFSFYSNKIITTGEGGMIVTDNKDIYERAKSLKNLAHSKKRFVHFEIGFNYRFTNLQAAFGLAQLEEFEKYINKKKWIANLYKKNLIELEELELPIEEETTNSVYWMYAVKLKKNTKINKNVFQKKLKHLGIDTRDFFYPMHMQPALTKLGLFKNESYPVSKDLYNRGFYLPTGLAITSNQINQVSSSIKKILDK